MHLLPLQNQKNVLVSKKMTNTMTERVRIAFTEKFRWLRGMKKTLGKMAPERCTEPVI